MIPVTNEIMAPAAPTIKCVQLGAIIKGTRGIEKEDDEDRILSWTVDAVYAHMVLARAGSRRRCFSYGDLIIRGLEYQDPELEALRKSY